MLGGEITKSVLTDTAGAVYYNGNLIHKKSLFDVSDFMIPHLSKKVNKLLFFSLHFYFFMLKL